MISYRLNPIIRAVFLAVCFSIAGLMGCRGAVQPISSGSAVQPARAVVVWISVDGLRHDYIERDRDRLPFFSRLMREGEFITQLAPAFPTITFPSHITEATGVHVAQHGVSGNSFYDSATKQKYQFPTTASLVLAEPIWITAPRQHVRTAVVDWPMSYQQAGPVRSDYFQEAFDKKLSDAQRLQNLLKIWRDDDPAAHHGQPLRLLMGYVSSVDTTGHKYGPDSQEVRAAVEQVDHLLGDFAAQAQEIFARTSKPTDRLFILITTDHGMSPVKTLVNVDHLLGPEYSSALHIVTNGCVADIHLDGLPVDDRTAKAQAIVARLREKPYVRAWTRDELPKAWQYDQPNRTGDVVACLQRDYTWSTRPHAVTMPAMVPGPLGMHGYPVEEDPDMLGFAGIESPGHDMGQDMGGDMGGNNLGRIQTVQLHPTVAKLLGISPAPGATATPVGIDLSEARESLRK